MITTTNWFVLVIWVLLFAFSLKWNQTVLKLSSIIVGFYFGLTMFTTIGLLSFVIIILELYYLFRVFFGDATK